jgi:Tol biopolymer transport system component
MRNKHLFVWNPRIISLTRKVRSVSKLFSVFGITVATLSFLSLVSAKNFGEWDAPVNAESIPGTSMELNTAFNDGCPIQSPDGQSLFIASNRPGTLGGQDLWIAERVGRDGPWGTPVNLGEPINGPYNDFCPLPARGHRLLFVSERPGGCGGGDIYMTQLGPDGWEEPQNLGCQINSTADEASPSLFEDEDGHAILYFSSTRPGGFDQDVEPAGDSDIYFSVDFGSAELATNLNTEFGDFRPNVRHDGREIVFDSNRPGGLGGQDIWTADRESPSDSWLTPVNLGPIVNSPDNETRATLSWDGFTMVFGSNRFGSEPGPTGALSTDVYVTTREKLTASSKRKGMSDG